MAYIIRCIWKHSNRFSTCSSCKVLEGYNTYRNSSYRLMSAMICNFTLDFDNSKGRGQPGLVLLSVHLKMLYFFSSFKQTLSDVAGLHYWFHHTQNAVFFLINQLLYCYSLGFRNLDATSSFHSISYLLQLNITIAAQELGHIHVDVDHFNVFEYFVFILFSHAFSVDPNDQWRAFRNYGYILILSFMCFRFQCGLIGHVTSKKERNRYT